MTEIKSRRVGSIIQSGNSLVVVVTPETNLLGWKEGEVLITVYDDEKIVVERDKK